MQIWVIMFQARIAVNGQSCLRFGVEYNRDSVKRIRYENLELRMSVSPPAQWQSVMPLTRSSLDKEARQTGAR